MDDSEKRSYLKMIGLIWILIESNLVAGSIFGFGSMFSVLPLYGIYESKCKTVVNDENTKIKDCSGQIVEYQLAFSLGLGFYNLLAILVGIINDYFGPRFLKLIAVIFHLISWLSLAFAGPGRDWLITVHTIFLSLCGICNLLASFCISAHFTEHRGLVTSLIAGAQLAGSIWFAIFQVLIDKEYISLSTLCFIWTSFSIPMLGSSILFFDWRFSCLDSTLKIKQSSSTTKDEIKTIASQDTLVQQLKDPLFIVVTLFLSCLRFTASFISVVWFPWIMYLTGNNLELTNRYTFLYNMSAVFGIIIAPLTGFILDYKATRGCTQKMFNISILQTLTWIGSVALCIVCMFHSIVAAMAAIIIGLFSRTFLVAGCQALIAVRFPSRFIGTLLGVMWTITGVINFATYDLALLARNPRYVWRTSTRSSWPILDGTGRAVYSPYQSSRTKERFMPTCDHCFNVRTIDGGRRMLVEKCGGYNCVSIVNSTDPDELNEPTQYYDLEQCGQIKTNRLLINKALQLKISTSIKNTLRPAEYPWLVRIESRLSIYSQTVTLCGGTLIHPQWIITAAHCMFDSRSNKLYPTEGIYLYMGHYDRLTTSQNEYITQPSSYIVHPKFRISRFSPAPIHDLALIKLSKPVPISSSIDIACLPESTDKLNDGTLAYTAGWGHSSPTSSAVNKPRKARIRISPQSCRHLMVDKNFHICGRNERGNNICSGDSGTGLLVRAGIKTNDNNRTNWKWHIFGVASYGLDECSENVNHDNAFSSVSIDIDWIHEMINKY